MRLESSDYKSGELKLVRDCIETELPMVHDAFGAAGYFDESRGEYVVEEEKSSVEERALIHTNQFKHAVNCYLKDCEKDNKDHKLAVDLDKKHSWAEVIECVKQTDRYRENSRGFRAKVKKYGGAWVVRNFPRDVNPSDPWLNLLPTDSYGCVLYGGLKIIITTAARISTLRTKIMDILEDIADTMQDLQEYLDIHPEDRRLVAAMTEYYIAILKAMGEMMAWSATRTPKKILSALKPGKYASSLEDAMTFVQKQRQLLKQRRDVLLHTAVKNIQSTVELVEQSVTEATKDANNKADKTISGLHNLETGMGRIETVLLVNNTMMQFLAAQLQETKWYNERLKAREELAEEKMRRQQANSAELQSPGQPVEAIIAKRKKLELHLHVPQGTATHDVQTCERWLEGSTTAEQSQAQWLLTASMFLEWYTAGQSKCLLVDGNCDWERISHVSFFASKFIQSLERIDGVHTIHFFCGLHDRNVDPLSGTTGIMRSLISQLLALHDFTFVNLTRDQLNQIEYRPKKCDRTAQNEEIELKVLCQIFQGLVAELPFNFILYCVVDGYSAYETTAKRESMRYVIKKLYGLTGKAKTEAIFKLLLCTPDPSRHVKKNIPIEHHLTIPNLGDIDADGDQMSDRDMSRVTSLAEYLH